MIETFLRNRTFIVKVNGTLSSVRRIECGLPKGVELSPTLFNLFINDLPIRTPDNDKDEHTMLYADDLACLISFKEKHTAELAAQQYLLELEKWKKDRRLTLTPHKCSQIVFSRARKFDVIELDLKL